jgi:hypothetical protein
MGILIHGSIFFNTVDGIFLLGHSMPRRRGFEDKKQRIQEVCEELECEPCEASRREINKLEQKLRRSERLRAREASKNNEQV